MNNNNAGVMSDDRETKVLKGKKKRRKKGYMYYQSGKPGLTWLKFCCSHHFSQMEKVGSKWN